MIKFQHIAMLLLCIIILLSLLNNTQEGFSEAPWQQGLSVTHYYDSYTNRSNRYGYLQNQRQGGLYRFHGFGIVVLLFLCTTSLDLYFLSTLSAPNSCCCIHSIIPHL